MARYPAFEISRISGRRQKKVSGPTLVSIKETIFNQEKPDPNAKPAIDFDNKIAAERERQMKVIVPNSTAGMIIGKGGSFIKHLKVELIRKGEYA